MADSKAEPAAELARMQRLATTYARLPSGATLHTCGVCTEVGQLASNVLQYSKYIAVRFMPTPTCPLLKPSSGTMEELLTCS
jgi:hypothetical protein